MDPVFQSHPRKQGLVPLLGAAGAAEVCAAAGFDLVLFGKGDDAVFRLLQRKRDSKLVFAPAACCVVVVPPFCCVQWFTPAR